MNTETEKRRSPRVRAHIPIVLVWQENQQEHREQTFTLNVSWFGCATRSHNFFRPGDRVRVERNPQAREAVVVYSLKDYSRNLVEVGLAFDQDSRDFWGITNWAE